MASYQEFYLDRVAEARAGASAATLRNVRQRWFLAEATWTELAGRQARAEKVHNKLIADKASERAASKAAAAA